MKKLLLFLLFIPLVSFSQKSNDAKLKSKVWMNGKAFWAPPDFYYGDYITDEIQEEWLNKLLKFIEGIKNGNKLYLKIDNEITFKSQNIYDLRSWRWNEFFESIGHTYIIDLTGSSKALQF